jgi:hypothetical protein
MGLNSYGTTRQKNAGSIGADLNFLGAMCISGYQLPQFSENIQKTNSNKKKTRGYKNEFTLSFQTRFMECTRLDVEAKSPYDTYWSMRFGDWTKYYLNTNGLFWFSRMPRKLLELDRRITRPRELFGKKLGYAIVGFSEGASKKSSEMRRGVGGILQTIGELPHPKHLNRNWGARTRRRFEGGLELLKKEGILASYRYSDQQRVNTARYFSEPWLNNKLIINF